MSGAGTRTRTLTWGSRRSTCGRFTRDTGRVICEAEVLYRGRRQATSEALLTAADSGKLLAHGAATCMPLDVKS